MLVSELISRVTSPCRDALARGLLRAGLRPNHVTVLGMLLTIGAGVAVAMGRAHWRPWAVPFIIGAGACDMLDGAMAHVGGLRSRFGAVFDSTCDRASDAGLYLGAVFYYLLARDAASPGPAQANLTMALLASLGLVWAYATSYLRARAHEEGAEAHGGFWQRGERVVTMMLGLGFHHLATAVWILGLAPAATVAHRLWRARRTSGGPGRTPPGPDEPRGLLGLLLFRWQRLTVPFDIQAGATILALALVDLPDTDLLRRLAAWWVGA